MLLKTLVLSLIVIIHFNPVYSQQTVGVLQYSSASEVIDQLEGSWEWTQSCGGFSGDCSYANSNTNYRNLVFTRYQTSADSVVIYDYRNDTLYSTKIEKIYLGMNYLYGQEGWILTGGISSAFTDLNSFSLQLTALCSDCYQSNFTPGGQYLTNDTETTTSDFKIFPNPSSQFITISHNESITPNYISVLNLNGQTLKNWENQSDNLDISSLPKGQYLIKIQTKHNIYFKQLIIN